MPLYDYQCANCKKITEVRHGFDDTYNAVCEACGGELKRLFNAAPIVFKGSGFYVTDSRPKSSESSDTPPAAAPAPANEKKSTPAKDAPSSNTPTKESAA